MSPAAITKLRNALARLRKNSGYLTGCEQVAERLLATLDAERAHHAAIETEARAALLADIRERVEGLITGAGGRCVRPDDYDPGELNVCETHSELIFEEGCEDQPHELLRVLAELDAS
jgi:hypothetical protein